MPIVMYLVTSKSPTGQVRRAIAATAEIATGLASRMRGANPAGMVVIERPDGATILGCGHAPAFPFDVTQEVGVWT